MPTKPGWTDIDFIGAYNAANSTDWKTSLAWFLWVPSAGKYWIAVDMFAGDGVTESPGSWAIIDPITRSIEGFSDESGFTHTTIDNIVYSESDGCVWTKGRDSSYVGFYYTKYASDGTVLAQSSSPQSGLNDIYVSPVTGQLYGWQNNSPSPGYQIKTVNGATGEEGSAVITSTDPLAIRIVFDGAGDIWYTTNPGPTSTKVWRYDVAGATSYEALSVSGTTDLPYLWLYNSRDDTILLSYPSGSPKKIKWINVSDYSVAETVEFGSDWSNSIRSFDEFDTYRGKVWCWISAYYGLITVEAYALVDPADWDAEPEYYEWGAYGGGYAVTNGYQHEVCVDAAVYDPAEIYYTRIWPCSNVGTAAPLYSFNPVPYNGVYGDAYLVYVESTGKFWWPTWVDQAPHADGDGWFAILNADMSISGWTTGTTGGWYGSSWMTIYDPVNDCVWTNHAGGGDSLAKFNSDGSLAFDVSMPADCGGPYLNTITGDVYVAKRDWTESGRTRWIYKIDITDGSLGDLLYESVSSGTNINHIVNDNDGRVWISVSTSSGYIVVRVNSDGTGEETIWSAESSSYLDFVTGLAHDSTADRILVWRRYHQISGSTNGSRFFIDCATGAASDGAVFPSTWRGYSVDYANWGIAPSYDPVRNLFWHQWNSDGTGPKLQGNDPYHLLLAFDPDTWEVVYGTVLGYLGHEVDTAPYFDDPLNDYVSPYDFGYAGPTTNAPGGKVYITGWVDMWNDAESTELTFPFVQWIDIGDCTGTTPVVTRRRAIINIIMRRRFS